MCRTLHLTSRRLTSKSHVDVCLQTHILCMIHVYIHTSFSHYIHIYDVSGLISRSHVTGP